jgi:hypothetical protein
MSNQRGYGLGGVFRSAGRYVNPILEEVGKIGATVGADLAKNLLTDVIEGKNIKEAARERGKQAGTKSLNLAGERVVQKIQEPKTSKAPQKPTKRPRSQSVGTKKSAKKPKKSQKGGLLTHFLTKKVIDSIDADQRKKKRKRLQKGGAKSGSRKKKSQKGGRKRKRAVGVVFPRAMTSKQRRSLPAKDIFG